MQSDIMQPIISDGIKLDVVSARFDEADARLSDLRSKYGSDIRTIEAGDYSVCTGRGVVPSGEFPVNGKMRIVLSDDGKPLVGFRIYPALMDWARDLMCDDTPESLVEDAGGNPVVAAQEFCEFWLGICKHTVPFDNYQELRRQLREDYGMTAWEFRTWLQEMLRDEVGVSEVRAVKRIVANGGGYCIAITKEVEALDLHRGDEVEIIVRRKS